MIIKHQQKDWNDRVMCIAVFIHQTDLERITDGDGNEAGASRILSFFAMVISNFWSMLDGPRWHPFSRFFPPELPHLEFLVAVLTSGRGGRKWPNIGLSGWVGRVGALLKIKTLFSHNPVAPVFSFNNDFLDAPASLDLYPGMSLGEWFQL